MEGNKILPIWTTTSEISFTTKSYQYCAGYIIMESLCKHKSTILVYMNLNVRVVVVYMGTIVFHTHFSCVFITVKAVTIYNR